MTNSMIVLMKTPYFRRTGGTALPAASTEPGLSRTAKLEKSTPPRRRPMGGMITSATMDVTILPKATPMISPTARSSTLPFTANSRNSLRIGMTRLLARPEHRGCPVTLTDEGAPREELGPRRRGDAKRLKLHRASGILWSDQPTRSPGTWYSIRGGAHVCPDM